MDTIELAVPEAAVSESVTGNELASDTIFMQRFKVLQESKRAEFRERLVVYAKQLLNDPNFGIVFYKVDIFSNHLNPEVSIRIGDLDPSVDYILHFHTFAVQYLTKNKVADIETKYLPSLLDDNIAEISEKFMLVNESTDIRKPVYS